jgi:hypothetical protein
MVRWRNTHHHPPKGETKPTKGPADPRWFAIPPKYADPAKSGLQYEVTRGKNTWDVPLKD